MRILNPLILFITVCMACTSCEQVINIDLNQADSRYVIEGEVCDTNALATVRISQTKNFEYDNSFAGVSQATVTITEGDGEPVLLPETEPGIYKSTQPMGTSGETYYLRVQIGSEIFTGTSTMPDKVSLDSLYVKKELFPGKMYILPYLKFNDPRGVPNFYRYRLFVNGHFIKMVSIDDDEYTDGLTVNRTIFYFGNPDNTNPEDDDGILEGAEVSIEMQCIDQGVYQYFFTLQQTIEQSSSSPANPISNLTGGALGYFSAFTSERKTLTVPNL